MRATNRWIRLVSHLVPGVVREDWVEEWDGELAVTGGTMRQAWGALADAWYLRTEGWTMDGTWRDIRMAVRSLVRKPLFTVLAGGTVAIGIGANTAIFSVVDSVLLNPLPFPESHRIVSYNHEAPGLGVKVPVMPHSQAMYLHYQEHARAVEHFAAKYDTSDIDGVRIAFEDGWGLIRASNTQPVLVMRFEASNDANLAAYRGEVEEWLREQGVG